MNRTRASHLLAYEALVEREAEPFGDADDIDCVADVLDIHLGHAGSFLYYPH
jgi:hypothetical protein